MNPVRIGLMAVASPLEVGAGDAPGLAAQLGRALRALGEERLELTAFPDPVDSPARAGAAGRAFYDARVDAILLIAASWFQDYLALDALEECAAPVIAWARPGMETGALCGTQQLGYILRQLGQPYTLLYAPAGDGAALSRAWDFARAASLRRRLRRARIGYWGHRVEGMTETTAHELALKKVFGPRVVGIDANVPLDLAARLPPETAVERWEALTRRVGRVLVSREAGIEALRLYEALREVIAEHGLDALTVGCYPNIFGKACLAASLLGEEGVPLACEGDVNGALAMLMLADLTGAATHCTDALDPIPADDSLVFSHCGSGGFSLAADPSEVVIGTGRLMGGGVCCLFPARPGPVTLVNLIPTLGGYKLAVMAGEAVATEMVFPGNPLRVRFGGDYRAVLDWIAAEGLGHHWMAAYGDLRRPLRDLAAMTGCAYAEHSGV